MGKQKLRRYICIALAVALGIGAAALLAACKKEGDPPPIGSVPSEQSIDFTIKPPPDAVYEGKAVIGKPGALKEAPFVIGKPEVGAADLLGALQNETGWNLAAANITWPDAITVRIDFKEESSIYAGPPETQKEAYKADAGKDFTLLVLNSVVETLLANQCGTNIRFGSPDGGTLNAGGVTWQADANWDYNTAAK